MPFVANNPHPKHHGFLVTPNFSQKRGIPLPGKWPIIKGRQLDTGTIIITEDVEQPVQVCPVVVVYARVSAKTDQALTVKQNGYWPKRLEGK